MNRNILSRLISLASCVIIGAGSYLSLTRWEWHWFARSGALMVTGGVVVASFDVIRYTRFIGHLMPVNNPEPDNIQAIVGFDSMYLLILGTLIWGFGDLPSVLWTTNPF